MDLTTALAAYAAGSVPANHLNHLNHPGSLCPGNRADLVVLDRDPFLGPAEAVGDTRAHLTYVDGRRVDSASDA